MPSGVFLNEFCPEKFIPQACAETHIFQEFHDFAAKLALRVLPGGHQVDGLQPGGNFSSRSRNALVTFLSNFVGP